jgi:hypothetical protein
MTPDFERRRRQAWLKAEHDALVGESLAGMAKRFGLLDRFRD